MSDPHQLGDATLLEIAEQYGTPTYVFDWRSVLASRSELGAITSKVPVRNWFSMKTAPVKPLLEEWRKLGESIEVVSPHELRAAMSVGYQPHEILINGPGKSDWLKQFRIKRINVIFDSVRECEQLGTLAKDYEWTTGLRLSPDIQTDPDDSNYSTQFGILSAQIPKALEALRRFQVDPKIVHFHLRSNVSCIRDFELAISEVIEAAKGANLAPSVLDCGGGLPVPGEMMRDNNQPTWNDDFLGFGDILSRVVQGNVHIKQIWLENGRFLVGRAGTLLLRALDVKQRRDARYVICDGGRVTNAFPSDWERHRMRVIPQRIGSRRSYSICGPTCMAYDWIERDEIELDIKPGDLIVWENAGAYHLPWESQFSFGTAAVVWVENEGSMVLARPRQSFEHWWGRWT